MLVHGASGGVRHVLSLHGCHIYNRPQTKLRKSIFFTGVCLSWGGGGWVSLVPCPFRGWVGMFRASPGGGTHPPDTGDMGYYGI